MSTAYELKKVCFCWTDACKGFLTKLFYLRLTQDDFVFSLLNFCLCCCGCQHAGCLVVVFVKKQAALSETKACELMSQLASWCKSLAAGSDDTKVEMY